MRIFRIVGANLILLGFIWLIWNTFDILFTVIGVLALFLFMNAAIDKELRESIKGIFSDPPTV
jgi:hypothetical protein